MKNLISLVTLACLALTSACGTTYTYRVSSSGRVAVKDPRCQQRRLTVDHCEERQETDSGDNLSAGLVTGLVIVGALVAVMVVSDDRASHGDYQGD